MLYFASIIIIIIIIILKTTIKTLLDSTFKKQVTKCLTKTQGGNKIKFLTDGDKFK